jgi:GNAT superfamily N-acetyltransferase
VTRTGAITLRAPEAGDWGWIVSRHGALYASEYGWGARYEAFVARLVADYVDGLDPAAEAAWIAELDGTRVGSIACARRGPDTAQLRVLLVEPSARGHGVGALLIDRCLSFAAAAGYRRIMLWTATGLDASRRLYERAGFTLDAEPGTFPFDDTRVEQVWSRPL